LWVVADHTVTTYDGDLEDYRRMVLSARGMRTNSHDRGGNERGTVATRRHVTATKSAHP
jgi:ATP-binding cassette subfamily F protein 3